MGMIKGNAVIGQSGGPTAVINQSLVGVIETLKGCRSIPKILGANHGVRGMIEEKFFDRFVTTSFAVPRCGWSTPPPQPSLVVTGRCPFRAQGVVRSAPRRC